MQRTSHLKISSIVFLSSLSALACQQDKAASPPRPAPDKQAGDAQGARSSDEEAAARDGNNFALPPDAAFLDADFKIEVKVLGAAICDGSIKIKINAAIGAKNSAKLFEVPSGIVDCTVYKFDLAEILGSITSEKPKIDVKDPLVVKDGIIAMKALGNGLYEPPRPLFPSFLAEERETLQKLDKRVSLRLTDKAENKSADGSVHLKMTALGAAYTAPAMQRSFPDTMQFELGIEGFDGVNKVGNFIFERMAFVMSLNPIALLHLEFAGPASDLASGAAAAGIDIPKDDAGIVDGLINVIGGLVDVEVTLDLVKMENLGKTPDPDDKGPVIGG
jgi:hypothetical protein